MERNIRRSARQQQRAQPYQAPDYRRNPVLGRPRNDRRGAGNYARQPVQRPVQDPMQVIAQVGKSPRSEYP